MLLQNEICAGWFVLSLKDDLYSVNKGKTFAENIDLAWIVYKDGEKSEEERLIALSFLIFAFDLKETDDLNRNLMRLMGARDAFKGSNAEYIPELSPEQLRLKPPALIIKPTEKPGCSKDKAYQDLFNQSELLDVHDPSRELDKKCNTHFFRLPSARARFRVHIFKGHFFQGNTLFDTSEYIAHGKKTYAAFTLNANGELSVFPHQAQEGKLCHSSMNAGAPVVGAGELVIKKGKLLAINTHSGHYQPSVFNLYRTLQYFDNRGIDLSHTKVQLGQNPQNQGIKEAASLIHIKFEEGGAQRYYELPACAFLADVREQLQDALQTMKTETEQYQASYKTSIYKLFSPELTQSRITLVLKLQKELDSILDNFDIVDRKQGLKRLDDLYEAVEVYKKGNQLLSTDKGKKEENGRLNTCLTQFMEKINAVRQNIPEEPDLEALKLIF